MSVLRVTEVRDELDTGAGLAAGRLLAPSAGAVSPSLLLHGWVLGSESRALAVEAVQGEHLVRVAPVREPSPGAAQASPDRPEAAHCEFITRLHAAALDPDQPLILRAVLADGRRARMAVIELERPPERSAPSGDGRQPARPSLRPRIEQLIGEATASDDDPRMAALEPIPLEGKQVLVLESGAGHLARAARARGAALVDGVEPDERLLLLARLLNAYHGTTRVSFSESPLAPRDAYDVVVEP